MSLGVNYEMAARRYAASKTSNYGSQTSNYRANYQQPTVNYGNDYANYTMNTLTEDVFSLSHNSGCTDGKDDGKIGLAGVVENTAKGAAKSIVNGVKGCFTDANGNFSIGKTLFTVAAGAACVAFPAVGLAACTLGAITGGAQVLRGVGGALSAQTDAQAKEAWQNVGAGTFTTVTSAVGAKAAFNAMEATSNAAALSNVKNTLGENATLTQKAGAYSKALLEDAVSSTQNSYAGIKQTAANFLEGQKVKVLRKQVEGIEKNSNGAFTDKEMSILRELDVQEAYMTDEVRAFADTSITGTIRSKAAEGASNAWNTVKEVPSKIKGMKLSDITDSVKNLPEGVGSIITSIKESSFSDTVAKFGYDNVIEALEVFAGFAVTNEAV